MQNMSADKKVAVARQHLIVDQRFFGSLIVSMPCVPATRVRGFNVKTMATDGKTIWYNPAFVDSLTLAETKGVLMHEVLHKANGHHLRRKGRNPRIWNQACDYAINPIVVAAGQILPVGGLVNPAFADWSAEEVYEQLTFNPPPPPPGQGEKCDDGTPGGKGDKDDDNKDEDDDEEDDADDDDGDADDADDDNDADEEGDVGGGDQDEGDEPGDDGDGGAEEDEDEGPQAGTGADHGLILDPEGEDGKPLSDAEIEAAKDRLRVEIIQAVNLAQAAGDLPAGIEKLVEAAKDPRDDWRDVLRRFVTRSVETPVDQTWARPNRRFIHTGTYLPGWRKEDANELLIVLDTSGSTFSTPALPRFYSEMNRILQDTRPEKVTVIWCDHMVQKIETYGPGEEVPNICPGMGGTRFSPVWQAVKLRDIKPAGCVFFTDLICHDFGEQPDFPVLWAKWGHAKYTAPWGEVLDINEP